MKWFVVAAMVGGGACGGGTGGGTPPDAVVDLSQIRATLDVVADSAQAISVTSDLPGELGSDPVVEATFRGERVTLTPLPGTHTFVGSLAFSPALQDGEVVGVEVSAGGQLSVLSVAMPPPFELTSVDRTYCPFTIAWAPTASDPMQWVGQAIGSAQHPCSGYGSDAVEDTGSAIVPCIQPLGIQCVSSYDLERARMGGSVQGFLSGGLLRGRQLRGIWPR